MNGLVLDRPGALRIATDLPAAASPGPGEALVRVHRIGLCGTDYAGWRGEMPLMTFPRILGHELGVEVEAVGLGVRNVRPGDRCAVEPYLNCGSCAACAAGRGNCCERLRVLGVHADGGMRESLAVPAAKLHPARTLSHEALALVEPLAIGAHAVARAVLAADEAVLVIGAGPIGQAVMEFARIAGAHVTACDLNPARLASCAPVAHRTLANMPDGERFTAVFDATGHPGSMSAALRLVAQAGRLIWVGITREPVTLSDAEFHVRETTLLGSRNALPEDFTRIIGWMEAGKIDVARWITHRAALADLPERMAALADPGAGVLKAMLEVG
mgnify:FL=1